MSLSFVEGDFHFGMKSMMVTCVCVFYIYQSRYIRCYRCFPIFRFVFYLIRGVDQLLLCMKLIS